VVWQGTVSREPGVCSVAELGPKYWPPPLDMASSASSDHYSSLTHPKVLLLLVVQLLEKTFKVTTRVPAEAQHALLDYVNRSGSAAFLNR
jgi:hypothetical protein